MTTNHLRLLRPETASILKRAVVPLARVARQFESGRLNLFAPDRLVDGLFTGVEAFLDRIPIDTISTWLTWVVRDDAFWRPSRAGLTPRVRAFCQYFQELNEQHPYASTLLFMGSRYTHRGVLIDYLRAVGHIQRAAMTRRENRAEWLRSASQTIVESLYYELVSLVYAAERLKTGRQLARSRGGDQLGFLARNTATTLPDLFVGDEGRLRNAAVHYDRWRYSVPRDRILLTDNNWACDFSTPELLGELKLLLEDAMLPFQLLARLHAPDARVMLDVILSRDTPRLERIAAQYQPTLDMLNQLGWSPAVDSFVRR